MFSPSFYNPGSVGAEDEASISFLYRNQWTGYRTSFDGAGGPPNTQLLSVIVPVKGIPIKGVGLNISNDNLGPENNLEIQLAASHEFRLRFATIQIGIMPGLVTRTLNGNLLDPNDPEDPLIPNKRESQTKPDFGVGVYYHSNNGLYLGFSALSLIEPSFDFGYAGLNNARQRSYNIHGSTSYKLNSNITLVPSAIVRTNLILI
jgi:type IX secretion system PorP/SprF family membrane protein